MPTAQSSQRIVACVAFFITVALSTGAQLRRTALTSSIGAHPPDSKRLPNIGWLVRCGLSCSASLGGTPRAAGI